MRYSELITEIFDTTEPVQFKPDNRGGYETSFNVSEASYYLTVNDMGDNGYDIVFGYEGELPKHKSPVGNIDIMQSKSLQVFSKVINILRNFVDQFHPKYIRFSAYTEDGRPDLYRKMIAQLSKAYPSTVREYNGRNKVNFIITFAKDEVVESATEGSNDDELAEAMWWYQRWISGSEDDPDWDESWISHVKDYTHAFQIIAQTVGNKKSVGLPLWRALELKKGKATEVKSTMLLNPNHRTFQGFTTSKQKAMMIGEELFDGFRGGYMVCVHANIEPSSILFGIRDLKASKNPVVKEYLLSLGDWAYQDEVMVMIDKPLNLIDCEVTKL